jgi:hypothetical protein
LFRNAKLWSYLEVGQSLRSIAREPQMHSTHTT